jgi:hypothetical protein
MFEQAAEFLASALPWPQPGSWTDIPPWFVNIHYRVPLIENGRERQIYPGRACTSLEQALNTIEYRVMKDGGTDIYVCMSGQKDATAKVDKRGRTYWTAKRSLVGAVNLKSIWIDVDVKEKGFGTTVEAAEHFWRFRTKAGLPPPSFVIMSGSGGFHVHWAMTEPLEPQRWLALAGRLVGAMQAEGFAPIDYGVSTDAARLLRIPGTFNYKHQPPRPVYLHVS